MFLKTIILFFCVALCFLQCQGKGPDGDQLRIIKQIFNKHYGLNGLSYEDVIRVVDEVKEVTGAKGGFPSLVEMETALERHTFLGKVLRITQGADADDKIMGLVRKKIELCELKPYGINFDNLRDIIIKARLAKRIDKSTDVKAQLKTDLFSNKQYKNIQ